MNILGIESSSTVCGVAFLKDNNIVYIDENISPKMHGKSLPLKIDKIMKKENKLDAIAVSSGPGSYTGLRIGINLAKGIAAVKNIPIIPVPTLLSLNTNIIQNGGYCIMLHSHKNFVYSQRFLNGEINSEIEFDIIENITYKKVFGYNLDGICKNYTKILPSAKSVVELAKENYNNWIITDLSKLSPNYITNFNLNK
tara:strand:- start:1623 stop:2213 length:591 start_codon:yes stop_codon:yes gene_type:complete